MIRSITILLFLWAFPVSAKLSPWEKVSKPTKNASSSIGSYANGCLDGARALPLHGVGYQVIRPQRQRYYGHVDTLTFVESLGAQVFEYTNASLLIGDISLPRGGRFSSGHTSHQTGLDIDIWLRLVKAPLSENQLAVPTPISMVDLTNYKLRTKNWDSRHFEVIRFAAKEERVARIFVHPVIKQQLCHSENGDKAWLRKVRPWWGHHSHFHVRLTCPEKSDMCTPQADPPPGDGCGDELASWAPVVIPEAPAKKTVRTSKKKPKVMPSACDLLITKIP